MCGKWSVDPPSFNCSRAKTLTLCFHYKQTCVGLLANEVDEKVLR